MLELSGSVFFQFPLIVSVGTGSHYSCAGSGMLFREAHLSAWFNGCEMEVTAWLKVSCALCRPCWSLPQPFCHVVVWDWTGTMCTRSVMGCRPAPPSQLVLREDQLHSKEKKNIGSFCDHDTSDLILSTDDVIKAQSNLPVWTQHKLFFFFFPGTLVSQLEFLKDFETEAKSNSEC